MMPFSLSLLFIGVFQILIILIPFIIIVYFVIPNRKFKNILENEIDEKIKALEPKERVSLDYKKIKISLKRVNNKLVIEPYTNKIIELLFRIIGFFFSFLVIIIILTLLGMLLNTIGLGNTNLADGRVRIYNWNAVFQNSMESFGFLYFIAMYFFGRYLRRKALNTLLIKKHKNDWDEFLNKYAGFKF